MKCLSAGKITLESISALPSLIITDLSIVFKLFKELMMTMIMIMMQLLLLVLLLYPSISDEFVLMFIKEIVLVLKYEGFIFLILYLNSMRFVKPRTSIKCLYCRKYIEIVFGGSNFLNKIPFNNYTYLKFFFDF